MQAAAHRTEEEISSASSAFDPLADWEPETSSQTNAGFIPRIAVEGDTNHIDRAEEALALAGIPNRIVGGIGSRGKIWGHATFEVVSPLETRLHLVRVGFIQSPESKCILIDSTNGSKVRLLARSR